MEKEKDEFILRKKRKVTVSYLPEIIAGILLMITFFAILLILLH